MQFNVKIQGDPLQGANGMLEAFSQELAVELAQAQIANMRLRTQKGIGLNDAPMPPYSEGYRERKQAAGRQSSKRDLLFTGRMMRDLQVIGLAKQGGSWVATIGFTSEASRLKAEGNHRRAKWFGISANDNRRLLRLWQERVK